MLGIDAAWTATNPSGVALVVEEQQGWTLNRVAASYGQFMASGGSRSGGVPDPALLLATCCRLTGSPPDLVAVDMPLSLLPIIGRRTSDNLVSRAYGGRKAGTHTPSQLRPGPLSDGMLASFAALGYPLQVGPEVSEPGLVEVYPHPALIELTGAALRLPYKLSRVRQYWPEAGSAERRARLFGEWRRIVAGLDVKIAGVSAAMAECGFAAPSPCPLPRGEGSWAGLKPHEDKLDAIICAWVGICVLDRRAQAYGDALSAIWVPTPANV